MMAVAERERAVTPTVTANTTTVSGTLTDKGGTKWGSALIVARFQPAPSIPGPYFWGETSEFQKVFILNADGGGGFSIGLPDNTTIMPSRSMWQFTIAPAATMPAVTFSLMIAGSSMDISSIFTAQSYQLQQTQVQSLFVPRAYSDEEVASPSNNGQLYYNSQLNEFRYWEYDKWIGINGMQVASADEGPAGSLNGYTSTGTVMFELAPQGGTPNPSDVPVDTSLSILETFAFRGPAYIGAPGYILQRFWPQYDFPSGGLARFFVRCYSDSGGNGIFGWQTWWEYRPTKAVPTL